MPGVCVCMCVWIHGCAFAYVRVCVCVCERESTQMVSKSQMKQPVKQSLHNQSLQHLSFRQTEFFTPISLHVKVTEKI